MRRTVILAFAAICLSGQVWSAPFAEWFSGTSPKGASVRVWGEGDEYSIHYEAEDGHAVVKDLVTRTYFYARQEADGALVSTGIAVGDETDADRAFLAAIPLHQWDTSAVAREARQKRIDRDESETGRRARWAKQKETMRKLRRAKKSGLLMAPPSRPTIGTVKGLTLLIDFPVEGSDKTLWETEHPSVTPEKLSLLLNADTCSFYGNASSVRRFYLDASNGALDYYNEVIGPILAPHPRAYYDDASKDNGDCATNLIAHVFDAIKGDPDYATKYLPVLQSLSVQNGHVRSFNIWFAGPSGEEWGQGLWAHKWAIGSSVSSRLTFTVNGSTVRFYNYQITPVTSTPGIYTFCHENGHMLCDFPDLYNYEKSVSGNRGVGYFSLMYGSADKLNPPFFDAYLRAAAGWVDPQVLPAAGGTVTVRNNHADVWKYENPNNEEEYYLIENRQQTGRDASIPASGILIWRCNEAGDNCHPKPVSELTGFGNDVHRWPYELSLEQADGKYQIEQNANTGDAYDAWYGGNGNSQGVFNDTSLPTAKWSNATDSGLSLGNFSANGDTMTFKVAAYAGGTAQIPLAEALDNDTLVFTTGGDADWFGQTEKTSGSASAAKSGTIGHGKSTWMQTAVTGPGTISFQWRVSSESVKYDYLEFLIDGAQQDKIGGTTGDWAGKTYPISEGVHVLCWNYLKDSRDSSGEDAGYVDRVVWTPDEKVADPMISGPTGADFVSSAEVVISCDTKGATIRYTLDGSDPTETSAAYDQPIVITAETGSRRPR